MLPQRGARGVYALLVELTESQTLDVGSLGRVLLPAGVYVYVGSAMGRGSQSLHWRVRRHLSVGKRLRWHIDYLLASPGVAARSLIFAASSERMECRLVGRLYDGCSAVAPAKGFGSSDCWRGCLSHLLLLPGLRVGESVRVVGSAFCALGLPPAIIEVGGG